MNERTGEEVRRFIVSYMKPHEVARLAREHGVDYLSERRPPGGRRRCHLRGVLWGHPLCRAVSELEQPLESEDRHDEGPGFPDVNEDGIDDRLQDPDYLAQTTTRVEQQRPGLPADYSEEVLQGRRLEEEHPRTVRQRPPRR